MRNHIKLGVSLRVLYFAMDTGYGLGRSGLSFPLRLAGGWLEFVAQAFGDSLKLRSSKLAIL